MRESVLQCTTLVPLDLAMQARETVVIHVLPATVAALGSGKSEPLDAGGLSLAHFLCLILSQQIKHSLKCGRRQEE